MGSTLVLDDDMGAAQVADAVVAALGRPVDAEGLSLSRPPVSGSVRALASHDGRRLRVSYVALDAYPPSEFFSDSARRGELHHGAAARSVLVRCIAGGIPAYGVMGDPPRVVDAFGATAVYVPPASLRAQVKAGLPHAEAVARCESTLRAHAAWRDGVLCGVVVETFRLCPDGSLEPLDVEAEWPWLDLGDALAFRDAGEREGLAEPEPACGFAP